MLSQQPAHTLSLSLDSGGEFSSISWSLCLFNQDRTVHDARACFLFLPLLLDFRSSNLLPPLSDLLFQVLSLSLHFTISALQVSILSDFIISLFLHRLWDFAFTTCFFLRKFSDHLGRFDFDWGSKPMLIFFIYSIDRVYSFVFCFFVLVFGEIDYGEKGNEYWREESIGEEFGGIAVREDGWVVRHIEQEK